MIWNAIRQGTVLENVVLDPKTLQPKYEDDSLPKTAGRLSAGIYRKRVVANQAGHPKAVIFLSCDLYGVLPPVARLTKEQAAYYFCWLHCPGGQHGGWQYRGD